MDNATKSTIDTAEGIRRLHEIATRLHRSIRWALQRRGAMDAGNRAIGELNVSHGMLAYNILHSTLVRSLTIEVAAAFDWSEKRSITAQQKASIPSLVHHLRLPGVADRLLELSRQWSGLPVDQNEKDCRDALQRIEQRHSDCWTDPNFQDLLKRLREVRDYRLAHNLFDKDPGEMTYAQLFTLLDIAKSFAADGLLAVTGHGQDYAGVEREAARSANDLWGRALADGRLSDNQTVILPRHVDDER